MPDRGFTNDMKTLTIECPYCEWSGHFKDYEVRSSSLASRTECELLRLHSEMARPNGCAHRLLFFLLQIHLTKEHPNPVCGFCGERFNSSDALEVHHQRTCTKITVPCALKAYGCTSLVSGASE